MTEDRYHSEDGQFWGVGLSWTPGEEVKVKLAVFFKDWLTEGVPGRMETDVRMGAQMARKVAEKLLAHAEIVEYVQASEVD